MHIVPYILTINKSLSCITSATNLIKILTADSQSNIKVYQLIENLFMILNEKEWLKKYIFWELDLLKLLGYDLELESLVEKDILKIKLFIMQVHQLKKNMFLIF